MKKLILIVLLFTTSQAFSQTPFFDALKLRNTIKWTYNWTVSSVDPGVAPVYPDKSPNPYPDGYLKKDTIMGGKHIHFISHGAAIIGFSPGTDNFNTVKSILRYYSFHPGDTTFSIIKTDYLKNKFIDQYIVNGNVSGLITAANSSSASSFVGGLNVTNIADGLAQFLIERAEGEVNEAFFAKLKDFLDDYPEFATLFPNTNIFLSNSNSWEYSNLINTLKEAFDKDLKLLPADIIKLKDLDPNDCIDKNNSTSSYCKECQIRVTQIKSFFASPKGLLLLSACQVGNGIIQNQKIPDVINSIVQPGFLLAVNNGSPVFPVNVTNSLQLLNIMSLSLESNETGKNYITADQFKTLTSDPVTLNLYLGLLYQQIAGANNNAGIVINGKKVTDILTPQSIDGTVNYITNFFNQTKNLQTAIDKLTADRLNAKPDLSPDYAVIILTTQQVLQSLYAINIIDPNITIPADLNDFYNYTNQTLQIANDISIKNYNASVMNLLNLISEVIKASNPPNANLNNFCTNFLKYASFAANVVEAKTPADVKAAIEAVALPVGSYTVKQKSAYNISLNGYLGYGLDFNSLTHLSKGLFANGIYAPIGFSFTRGSSRKYGVPVSVFVSIIDLGSLVSYRLTNGSTDSLKQEVRLESIISPSAQLFLEIPKTPISVGAGWRLTPQLFYSNNTSFKPVPSRSVFNVSFLIDIPIFTLHNTPFEQTVN